MNAFLQDISYGFRMLLKNPAVTLVAVLSIALGVGVNSTVFSWVDAVLLHPLPGVARQNEIVAVKSTTSEENMIDSSYPDFHDLRDQSTLFSGWIAAKQRPFNLGEQGSSERVWAETVTGNYFDVLGVKPILGRTFNHDEQDERFGAHRVAVLSERLWHRKYNGDPRIVGQTILINRQPLTVIGVVPAEFRGVMNGLSYDLWIPLTIRPLLTGEGNWLLRRTSRPLQMLARLKPGVTVAQAQSEIDSIAERLGREYPQTNEHIGARALTLWDSPDGATSIMRVLLEVLLAVGALVLLIVCANVANLLLARATARGKEFAIRMGLGAGRGRLLRQLLTESFLLAFAGAMAGLLFTIWFTGFIDVFIPPTDMPAGLNPTVNGAVIGWTVALAFLTTFLCGVPPAIHAAYSNVNETLKAGGRGTSSSAASNRLRGLLVVGEVALAVVALIGAGLFVKSFHNAQQANPGFDPSKVLLAGIDLSTNGYSREQNLGILRRVTASMGSVPGVDGVVFSEDVPLGLSGRSWEDFEVPGYVPRTGENMKVWRNLIGPGYFQVLQVPLLEGREFNSLDTRDNLYVIVVNQTFVRRFLNGGPAVGRIVHAYGRDNTVVGVVRDGKYISIDEQPTPYFYLPLEQTYNASMGLALHVRTKGAPEQLASAVRSRLASIDPGIGITALVPMNDFMAAAYFAHRIGASLLSALGAIALTLAAIGLYGVMSYSIGQRTHEIGIRMALGASPSLVLRNVFGIGMKLAAAGVLAGLVLCAVFTRLASKMLYQVSSTDPATFAAVALFLAAVAAVASLLPARRATRIDPARALSNE